MQYTYVWDEKYALDNILSGWISKELIETILQGMKKKNNKIAQEIIIKWSIKINKQFHKLIWKARNEDMIKWEMLSKIGKKDKRGTKKEYKNERKR